MASIFSRAEIHGTPPPDAQARREFAFISNTVFFTLSTLTLCLRFWAHRLTRLALGWDDYLIAIGWFIAMMPFICIYVALYYGLGYHVSNLSSEGKLHISKTLFALQRANQPSMGCTKISILIFYMHIFTTKKFKIAAWANIVYTLLWAIIGWFVNLTVCVPIAYFYDKTIKGGYCKNQNLSGSLNGGFGAFGDVIILSLPVFMISRLHLNAKKKSAVMLIFLLGAIVCFASIYRIVEVATLDSADFTYSQASAGTWTVIEMQVAIISGNLPTLAPLFQRFLMSHGSYGKGTTKLQASSLNTKSQSRTVTGRRNSSKAFDGFERLDDDTRRLRSNGSAQDIELGDRNIHVKTELVTTSTEVSSEEALAENDRRRVAAWERH